VLDSPVYEHFAEGAPGLKELALLGHALRQLRDRPAPAEPEVVIVDAPATGHGVSLLRAPALVSDAIGGGPFGSMATEIAELVGSTERTGVVAVTLAEEMPVQEVLDLLRMLKETLERRPDLVVANGLYPPGSREAAARAGEGSRPHRLWLERRAVNERQLGRLREAWRGPLVELPLVARERGPDLVDALLERLARAPAATDRGERQR
jgi:hypothetical protein